MYIRNGFEETTETRFLREETQEGPAGARPRRDSKGRYPGQTADTEDRIPGLRQRRRLTGSRSWRRPKDGEDIESGMYRTTGVIKIICLPLLSLLQYNLSTYLSCWRISSLHLFFWWLLVDSAKQQIFLSANLWCHVVFDPLFITVR